MADIVTFLRARLDEDEAVAQNALHSDAIKPGEWITEHYVSDPPEEQPHCHIAEDRTGHYWSVAHDVFAPNAEHIARHDPSRVLAEIAAKREIVRLLDQYDYLDPIPDIDGELGPPSTPVCIARQMAAVYSNHPDHREEWADRG